MSNPPAVTHPAVSGGAIGFGTPTNPGIYVILLQRIMRWPESKAVRVSVD